MKKDKKQNSKELEQKVKFIPLGKNPSVFRNYEILEEMEAGVVLTGTEIKSLRNGGGNIKDTYAVIKNGECFLINMDIKPYEFGNRFNNEPKRTRKLLLTKREIRKLVEKMKKNRLTLVPISMYIKGKYFKIKLGLGRGKKLFDKRDDLKERDAKKKMQYAIKRKER